MKMAEKFIQPIFDRSGFFMHASQEEKIEVLKYKFNLSHGKGKRKSKKKKKKK